MELSQGAAGVLAGLAAAMGLAGAASVKMAADMQANKTAFTQLLGSAQAAETMLKDLERFAADTPFELPGLINASKKLLAFQFAAQDIIPIMAAVGDAVGLMGGGQEAIDGIVRALGQIQAKGKVSAEEMNQLSERGINGWRYIAEAMGKTTAEVMKLSEQGAIDSTTAINAVVMGMQKEFKGGMAAMSKEIPGLLSTLKDNAASVMRELGKQITDALDLKNVLQNATNQLSTFSAAVQQSGVKAAILALVPPEAVAAVFALSGALIAVAIPAIYTFAGGLWLAIAPMIPFIALGAAIGILAYEIWKNWEPLGDLFSGLWGSITAATHTAWGNIRRIFYTGVQAVLEMLAPIANLVGGGLQTAISGWLETVPGKIAEASSDAAAANADLAASLDKVKKASSGFHIGLESVNLMGGLPQAAPAPNTNFTGLHGTSLAGAPAAVAASGGAASEAAKEFEKLETKAKQAHESIEREWVQTTKTQLEQLEIWKNKEIEDLDVIKAEYEANGQDFEAYEIDKARVLAVYSSRRTKILQDEAKEAIDTFKSIRDGYLSIQKEIILGGLTGSKKDNASSAFDFVDKVKGVTDFYDNLSQKYETGNEKQKQNILKTLNDLGIAYRKTDQDKLDFSKATEDAIAEYAKQKAIEKVNNYATCKDIQADIDAAYAANSMAKLQEALTAENAVRMNDYLAQQEMMKTYQQAQLQAHSTTAQLVAELYKTGLSGLTTALSDIFSMTKSIGGAFKSLGQTMLKTITDYYAAQVAGQIMIGLFGKQAAGKQLASDTAAGAATAAAWWPAAIARSLATAGGNAGPAIAGMAAASVAGMAMGAISGKATGGPIIGPGTGTSDSILTWLSDGEYVIKASAVRALGIDALDTINTGRLPGLATGGIVTGPSLSSMGSSRYGGSVAELSKITNPRKRTNGSEQQQPIMNFTFNISAIDGHSVRRFFNDHGNEVVRTLRNQARAFNLQPT